MNMKRMEINMIIHKGTLGLDMEECKEIKKSYLKEKVYMMDF